MATPTLMAIDESEKKTSGRGANPNSQKALSRRGKGRPSLPEDAKRSQRNLTLSNNAWNGLLELAEAVNLSVSKLVEVVAISQQTLITPIRSLITNEVGLTLNLTIAEFLQLSAIEFVCRIHNVKRKSNPRKPKARLEPGRQTAQHMLTLSADGWTQLEQFAKQQELSREELIERVGRGHAVLSGTLYDLTSSAMVDRLQVTPAQLVNFSILEIIEKMCSCE